MVSVIILAAGTSSRMGEINKLLLPFGDTTVIEKTLSNIKSTDFDEAVVVVGHEREKIEDQIDTNYYEIVFNPDYKNGMTSTINCGINSLEAETNGYMICLSDMPLVTTTQYNRIIEYFNQINQNKKIVIPVFNNTYGNPRIISSVFKKDLLNTTYPYGGKKFIKRNDSYHFTINMKNDTILLDIDTMDNYEILLSRL